VLKKRKKSKKHYEFDESDKGFREKQRRQKSDTGSVTGGKKSGKNDWRDLIEDEEEEQDQDQEFDQDEE
jgi:hypothetical protein